MSSSAVTTKTSKYTYKSSGGGTADVSIEYSADLSALSRLEDKLRLLQEDLESERSLRQRIEREKADLSVQVIQMSERLEEAEGGAESVLEINRKRDAELNKLRKLLEDVHLESEETAHILKKKHQEIVSDFNEQIESLTKAKQRVEKEKSKLQAEIYELLSQIESVSKDKSVSIKTIEKLEVHVTELNIRIEELNRTIVDITSHKTRLSQENIDLVKNVQDLKINIESISFAKSQLNSQFEDARRRLEEEDRRRSILESNLHQVETELESVRLQLEEESEARLDLERQLIKANGEAGTFKSKYEAEVNARTEEVEEIRRKYTIRIQESEEHIESLQLRLSKLEKEKSRMSNEIEILIIDLEKANNGIREYSKRIEILEKTNIEIKTRLEETITLYDQSQRDLRQKTQDYQRLSHELDATREQKDQLTRDNNKMQKELHESRAAITDLTRRLHDYEVELRRLENEREELTAAYKEAESGRKAEEKRAQALSAEYGQFRHDTERRLLEKEEEIEIIRKQTSIEIEQLNARVVEAETKLKSEVMRIKKKLQIQITELEMSLDVANHTNIELQKTIKRQSAQLTEITAHYDEIQRQLQSTVDQYGIAQRRIQSLTGELEEIRVNYDSSLRSKRQVEVSLEEAQSRINELTVSNASYATLRSKLEQELQTLAADYEEVTRELRVSDERYQKVQVELKHTVELLHEEQERIVKIETIKKSLEVEVKQLSIRLEEVEVNAVAGSRRIISKLEARLRDIEAELEGERNRHSETIKILRKKERSVKEVYIQIEEDQKNIQLLQDALEKANQKIAAYKRQLVEQEQCSQQCVTKVRRFQRELEAAEDRADCAESNLTMVRAKHRTFVTTSTVPGSQVYLVQESTTRTVNESS
ncbi:paramyosin, long form [Culex quinquefasciatus]|uniref:Paramyosin, long form n=3 Tax=Culex pipiens complex TaxID=518105 RepID=B0WAN1_CULQU|nr:paramyosin, long form [Culex quinquefasciatus]|eukprot:XP_001845765.1 paramyosin, long form [Culex quinquefasciatus]